ncbi:methylated-DNA--[protein]-cysteine S-methyltransferase [Maridesulfovibrio sp. FT414]|uniref:methylated-DNA--[protein]-cysteine S-methyltransferase n=1 Tax=Maridesulfovibrio sp. FT414 TaxID=2979469 RepID=UPI003D80803A
MADCTYYTSFDTPLCEVVIAGNKDGLSFLHMMTGEEKRSFEIGGDWVRNDAFFVDARRQVEEFLRGERTEFDLKLNPAGTDFQKLVWGELQKIPCGTTCSYKEIAERIGSPKAFRAVGMANSRNPIPLIIPCHRVVGADGKLTGFALGLTIKRRLLELERGECD